MALEAPGTDAAATTEYRPRARHLWHHETADRPSRSDEPTAQTRRCSESLEALLSEYSRRERPLDVNFRELVGPIPVNDLSHSMYPYPARLLRQIPRYFLHCQQMIGSGDLILDPFCGSGTVLVEARAASIHGWGIDVNPFARLLSRVKTTHLDTQATHAAVSQVLVAAKRSRIMRRPPVVNVDLWFTPPVASALARLQAAILDSTIPQAVRDYLLVVLAATAERVSLRDPRIPVPVRRKDWEHFGSSQSSRDAWHVFEAVGRSIAARVATIPRSSHLATIVDGEDADQAGGRFEASLHKRVPRPRLVVTSPPYGAAQKYIRSTSLALGWANLASPSELAGLERKLVGREHLRAHELSDLDVSLSTIASDISRIAKLDRFRAAVYAHYFRAMNSKLANVVSLLAPDGYLVLVTGSNVVAGVPLATHAHLRALAVDHGMEPVLELRDTIRGRMLLTKRALQAAPLTAETVHVLHKPAK